MADLWPPDAGRLRSVGLRTHVLPVSTVLWRIHYTGTPHPAAWNRIRTWGPVDVCRWDPHPVPEGDHAPLGAAYFALNLQTCLAEVFQDSRFVDVDTGTPYITAFRSSRQLRLADLAGGGWLFEAGAKASVAFGDRGLSRQWARAIHDVWPGIDGIRSTSAPLGDSNIVVASWTNDVFPPAPETSVPMNSPAVARFVASAVADIGFDSNLII